MGGLSLAAGIGSSIWSAIEANKANKAATQEYNEKSSLLDNMFNRQYYSDITKRTEIQNMLRLLRENQETEAKRDESISAVTGATPEMQLAKQDSRNKSYANAVADIASNASALKDTYQQNYLNARWNLVNPAASIAQNKSNQLAQASTNLFGTGASLLGSGLDSKKKGNNTDNID